MSVVDRVEVAVKQIRQVPEGFALQDVVAELGSEQLAALEALLATGKQKHAAEAAGVHRNTIRTWLNTDPFFKAAYNAWFQETREAVRGSLNAAVERAAKNVQQAVDEGDRKLSYRLLKDLGHLSKQPDVAIDPRIIQTQMENELCRQSGQEELPNPRSLVALLLRARRAEKRRRRNRLLTPGQPQQP
jgi:hypothetical protein